MILDGGGGSSFSYPQGDPGGIDSAANALSEAASRFSGAAGQLRAQGSAVLESWSGFAANEFSMCVSSVSSGLDSLGGHHQDAADALRTYATALREAQAAATQAATGYGQAVDHFNTTMTGLSAKPPSGPGAGSQVLLAEINANDQLNAAYGTAASGANHACSDATHAAQACAAKLSQIATDMEETALHKFLALMGGPGTAFGLLGVESQTQTALKLTKVVSALRAGNWSYLKTLDPKAYDELEAVAGKYGENSSEALRAKLAYQEKVGDDAVEDVAKATTGLGEVPKGLAGAFDIVGKVGVGLNVITDVGTVADSQSTPSDRVMAGANLVGLGLAATKTGVGKAALNLLTDAAPDLITMDSVGAWVPGVGEVLVAGTTLYFAGEFIYQNWGTISHWADDVGNFASQTFESEVQGDEQLVKDGLNTAGTLIHDGGQVVSGAVHEGEHIVSGAVKTGEHLASDLDPLNW